MKYLVEENASFVWEKNMKLMDILFVMGSLISLLFALTGIGDFILL